jgi:O-antigen/teichoic acid export membrane protein
VNATKRYFLLSFLSNYLTTILQVITTVVIVRLLTPYEMGQFAIAAVFAQIAGTLREFGVGDYIVQSNPLTRERKVVAFTVSLCVSWSFAILLYGISFLVAMFYRDPMIQGILAVQSLSFVLIPFCAVTMALFQRSMAMGRVLAINVITNLVNMAVSISCAYHGMGAISLAWGSLAAIVVQVVVAYLLAKERLIIAFTTKDLPDALRFGFYTVSMFISTQLGRSLPDLVVGRVLGLEAVAYIARAGNLVELYQRLVTRSAAGASLPYFARLKREQGHFIPALLQSKRLTAAVGWPACLLMIATADWVIRILFGPQWSQVVAPAQIILFAAMIDTPFVFTREALIAQGLIKQVSTMQMFAIGMRLLCLLVGVQFGLMGVAYGMLLGSFLASCLYLQKLKQHVGVDIPMLKDVYRDNGKILLWVAVPLAVLFYPGTPIQTIWQLALFYVVAAAWILWGYRVCQHPIHQLLLPLYRKIKS